MMDEHNVRPEPIESKSQAGTAHNNGDDHDEFHWWQGGEADPSIVVNDQEPIAVYRNHRGDLVIRRHYYDYEGYEDAITVVGPLQVPVFIERIRALFSDDELNGYYAGYRAYQRALAEQEPAQPVAQIAHPPAQPAQNIAQSDAQLRIEAAIRAHPNASNRAIARMCCVSEATVRNAEERIIGAPTSGGGYTADQLAALGVPWPPPNGWKRAVVLKRLGVTT